MKIVAVKMAFLSVIVQIDGITIPFTLQIQFGLDCCWLQILFKMFYCGSKLTNEYNNNETKIKKTKNK